MATKDFDAIAVTPFHIRGDGVTPITIHIGRNDTTDDIVIIDVTTCGVGVTPAANVNLHIKDLDSGFTEVRVDAGAAGQDAFINFHESGTHEAKLGWDASDNMFRINTTGGPSFSSDDFGIDENGNVHVGGSIRPASSVRNLILSLGTPPTAGAANAVCLYSENVSASAELKVMDEAGNSTTLSPHDENGEWWFHSVNKKTGKRFVVRMEKLVRKLVEKYPEDFAELLVEDVPPR